MKIAFILSLFKEFFGVVKTSKVTQVALIVAVYVLVNAKCEIVTDTYEQFEQCSKAELIFLEKLEDIL